MRFSVIKDYIDLGEQKIAYPTTNKKTGEVTLLGSRRLVSMEESGFRVLDNELNRKELSWYGSESVAFDAANILNLTRPQTLPEKEKE